MTAIELRQVSKRLGSTRVFEHFSMKVEPSGRAAVLGPSGCGKTTLLRLLAGLELPDEGEVLLDGKTASRPGWALPPHERGLSMAFQYAALWPHLSVAENIRFGLAGLPRAEADERIASLLKALRLEGYGKRSPHELSGGEARRVGLARALAPRSCILLLDEPLTNLNPELKAQALVVIRTHLEQYRPTLVYATHDSGEIDTLQATVTHLAGRGEG